MIYRLVYTNDTFIININALNIEWLINQLNKNFALKDFIDILYKNNMASCNQCGTSMLNLVILSIEVKFGLFSALLVFDLTYHMMLINSFSLFSSLLIYIRKLAKEYFII